MRRRLFFCVAALSLALTPVDPAMQVSGFGPAAGAWESATSPQGIVDVLYLREARPFVVEMYRRDAGRHAEFGRADDGVSWDGRRLRARVVSQLHPRSYALLVDPRDNVTTGLDLDFDSRLAGWTGTFIRGRQSRQIELRRPGRFARGLSLEPFVGRWCPSPTDYPPTCITVSEGPEGVLTGSTDRSGPCKFSEGLPAMSDCFGVSIDIAAAARMIFVGENPGGCCPNWFTGRLAADDARIDGAWTFGKSGGSSVTLKKVK
jgi:hypothetical protein